MMPLLGLTVEDKNIGKFPGKAGDNRKVEGPFGLPRGHPAESPSAGKPEQMEFLAKKQVEIACLSREGVGRVSFRQTYWIGWYLPRPSSSLYSQGLVAWVPI